MRYFFNDRDGSAHEDDEGTELGTFADAKGTAIRLLSQLVSDNPEEFWSNGDHVVSCTDDRGLVLFEIRASVTKAPAIG